jgi:membrane protein
VGKLSGAKTRVEATAQRGKDWVERQDPASPQGAAIGAWQRFQAVEGPLQSLLLTAYTVIAVLPALLVVDEYLERDPAALTKHLVRHFDFSAPTAALLGSVLTKTETHKLQSALLAIVGALFFGLNYGRVLQLVHARAWGLPIPRQITDYWRYAAVLFGLYGLILLLLVQNVELAGRPSWAALTISPGWIAVLVVYFAWAPWLLTRGVLTPRKVLPGAALTAVLLVAFILVSSFLLEKWVDFYAKDYGGFGVVMAVFFWVGFSSTIIVVSASLSPALAERRSILADRKASTS